MITVFYILISAAILCMLVSLVLVFRLRRLAKGGQIGRVVTLLTAFIVFFLAGYLVAPFAPQLEPELGLILAAVVFLFGAVFVIIVLSLISALMKKVFDELQL